VAKTHLRVEAYGTVDELSAAIGVARAQQPSAQAEKWLAEIQNQLFYLGADLATPADAASRNVVRIEAEAIEWLEAKIDHMTNGLPELKSVHPARDHPYQRSCMWRERCVAGGTQRGPVGA